MSYRAGTNPKTEILEIRNPLCRNHWSRRCRSRIFAPRACPSRTTTSTRTKMETARWFLQTTPPSAPRAGSFLSH